MKIVKRCFISILILFLVAIGLSACEKESIDAVSTETINSTANENNTYKVTFIVNDSETTQEVNHGDVPAIPGYRDPMRRVDHWVDENGNIVDPVRIHVTRDITLTAVVYPKFSSSATYLFPDDNGWLRPDAILTINEYCTAMEKLALSEDLLKLCLPSQGFDGNAAVTKEMLSTFYNNETIFPSERSDAALSVLPEGDISRSVFAESIDLLLARDSGKRHVKITGNAVVPHDIDPTDPEHIALLDSCIPHEESPSGKNISEAVLDMVWEEGFHLQDGFLFCANEQGKLLKNEDSGILHFGPDCKYTSGDEELDTLVADLIRKFQAETKLTDRYELLYEAFLYVRNELRYIGRGELAFGETGWESEWGKQALQSLRGNCYSYAAAFAVLARGLGYEAYGISGQVLEYASPHGWVEIAIDGTQLFFDPQLAAREVIYHERPNWGEDMFAITMDIIDWWKYIW